MRTPPFERLTSVDNALRLLHLLRDRGHLSVAEAAEALGVARSTAHRMLSTLTYRDFAVQAQDHRYLAGPAMEMPPGGASAVLELRTRLLPILRTVVAETGETATASIRIGTRVRFIAAIESSTTPRIWDQEGTVLPAHTTSGGKAILATLPDNQLEDLYSRSSFHEDDWHRIHRGLVGVRKRGYAINHGEAESGVSAVGIPISGSDGTIAVAALSVAMTSDRFDVNSAESLADLMHSAARCSDGPR